MGAFLLLKSPHQGSSLAPRRVLWGNATCSVGPARWAGSRKPATQSHGVVRSFGPSNMEPGKFSQGITKGKEISDCGPICSQGLARPAWAQPSALQGGHRGHCEGRAISGPDALSVQAQDKHIVTTARKRDTKAQGKHGWCQRGGGRVYFCVKNGFNDK